MSENDPNSSKMLIITPEELAKLGIIQEVNSALTDLKQPHTTEKTSVQENINKTTQSIRGRKRKPESSKKRGQIAREELNKLISEKLDSLSNDQIQEMIVGPEKGNMFLEKDPKVYSNSRISLASCSKTDKKDHQENGDYWMSDNNDSHDINKKPTTIHDEKTNNESTNALNKNIIDKDCPKMATADDKPEDVKLKSMSKTGRIRKKINYLDMLNSNEELEMPAKKRRICIKKEYPEGSTEEVNNSYVSEINISDDHIPAIKIPGKRGRKKKVVDCSEDSFLSAEADIRLLENIKQEKTIVESPEVEDSQQSLMTSADLGITKIKVPGKRGRKKKIIECSEDSFLTRGEVKLSLENTEDEETIVESSESLTNTSLNTSIITDADKSKIVDNLSEDSTLDESLRSNTDVDIPIVKVPGKRGRPKKVLLEDSSLKTDSPLEFDIQLSIPKPEIDYPLLKVPAKRGRKKKIIECSEDSFLTSGEAKLSLENTEDEETIVESSESLTNTSLNTSIITDANKSKVVDNLSEDSTLTESWRSNTDVDTPIVKVPGKRGRPKKLLHEDSIMKTDPSLESDMQLSISKPEIDYPLSKIPAKRGRKKKVTEDSSSDDLSLSEYFVLNGKINCGVCHLDIEESLWVDHNMDEHYNLAWMGDEKQIVLKNNKKCRTKIMELLEKKEEIFCKICGQKFDEANEFINHLLYCGKDEGQLCTCAVCKMQMEKSKWSLHKYKSHANLAWRVGEPPLDLDDKSLVVNILTQLYKAKKPIYCGRCGISKKSVVGFLSHQTTCQKSKEELEDLRIQCELCDRKVLPVSMTMHIKLSHTPKKEIEEVRLVKEEETEELGKRKAHKQALNIIDNLKDIDLVIEHKHYTYRINFNAQYLTLILEEEIINDGGALCKFPGCECKFSSRSDTINHMKTCDKQKNSYFTCKYCLRIEDDELDIRSHISTVHNITCRGKIIVDNKADEFNIVEALKSETPEKPKKREPKAPSEFKVTLRPGFIPAKHRGLKSLQLFEEAFNWTYEFCDNNFTNHDLFPNLRADKSKWLLLEDVVLDSYLPQLNYSCDIAINTVEKNKAREIKPNAQFKKYELFESEIHENGNISIFAGGPISAMAWLPTPYYILENKQILAVSVINDPNKTFYHDSNYSERGLIQFWDFGNLRNRNNVVENPKLGFCIAHDFGPIWDLQWCPSGCHNVSVDYNDKRLGLLAVAASDSFVYIFAIPMFNEEESGLFYKPKPCLQLQHGKQNSFKLGKQGFYATKLSWSKISGHSVIAVGYSNGAVALFNLNMGSTLLTGQDSPETQILLPYKTFQAHFHFITGLQLLPFSGGDTYLVTGSFDRDTHVWELSSQKPILSSKKRLIITDLSWMTNWFGYISGFDESSMSNPITTTMTQIRDFGTEWANLLPSISTIQSISSSDWLNCVSQVSSSGETTLFIGSQMLSGLDNDKQLKLRKLALSTTNLIPTSKEDGASHLIYEDAIKTYKVQINDLKVNNQIYPSNHEQFQDSLTNTSLELYPLNSITKTCFNPNLQSSTFLVNGYQIGLLRILPLRFLSGDSQVK